MVGRTISYHNMLSCAQSRNHGTSGASVRETAASKPPLLTTLGGSMSPAALGDVSPSPAVKRCGPIRRVSPCSFGALTRHALPFGDILPRQA